MALNLTRNDIGNQISNVPELSTLAVTWVKNQDYSSAANFYNRLFTELRANSGAASDHFSFEALQAFLQNYSGGGVNFNSANDTFLEYLRNPDRYV